MQCTQLASDLEFSQVRAIKDCGKIYLFFIFIN